VWNSQTSRESSLTLLANHCRLNPACQHHRPVLLLSLSVFDEHVARSPPVPEPRRRLQLCQISPVEKIVAEMVRVAVHQTSGRVDGTPIYFSPKEIQRNRLFSLFSTRTSETISVSIFNLYSIRISYSNDNTIGHVMLEF
jgi:hypothetical protein